MLSRPSSLQISSSDEEYYSDDDLPQAHTARDSISHNQHMQQNVGIRRSSVSSSNDARAGTVARAPTIAGNRTPRARNLDVRSVKIVSRQPIEVPDSESESETETEEYAETELEDEACEHQDVVSDALPQPGPSPASGSSRHEQSSTVPVSRSSTIANLNQPGHAGPLTRAATLPAFGSSSTVPTNRAAPDAPKLSGSVSSPVVPTTRTASKTLPTGLPLTASASGLVIIAHDRDVQAKMDEIGVSWGTQFELARGVTRGWWQWSDVTEEKLARFAPNSQSLTPASVTDVMVGRQSRASRKIELWRELDREQRSLLENKTRGLGLMGPLPGCDQRDWYGGKIQQIVSLIPDGQPAEQDALPTFYMQLEPMQMGRSHRFARFLGSRRLLQIKLPKLWGKDISKVKKLFMQRFVLCGRVYVTFAVKDTKLHLVEINEDYQRYASNGEGDNLRLSLEQLVQWYNPLELNQAQKINKWTTRFDLGLSTSIPVLQFDPVNVFMEDDEYAPHHDEKVPTHKIFTDGCGFMNMSALVAIGRALNLTERPTAVQGRILGSKGVWTLHPDYKSLNDPPRIWIRPSQQKIRLVAPRDFNGPGLRTLHRAHLIFDLVAPPRVSIPSRLSMSTIINLDHNGVPKEVFIKLMEEGLTREVEALTQWHGAGAMRLLWDAVNKASGVTSQRLQRTAMGIRRALGLTSKRTEDEDSEDEDDNINTPAGEEHEGPAAIDTPPFSIGESVMDRLQAGFSPLSDRIMYDDIKRILEETMKSFVKEYRISVPQSAEAFIIPDPTGILKPGQIYFRSSQYLKDPLEHSEPNIITGDALIFRNPARVASDVQKVKAVQIPELVDYIDVIVVPTQGEQSLPSLLAGGDVDGDTAVCIFDPALVEPFRQPETVNEPPDLISENFEPLDKVPSVANVLSSMEAAMHPRDSLRILHEHLLTGLADTRVGLYSRFHDNAVYSLGYNHQITIRIAFMFTTILDSRKSGLILKESVLKSDRGKDYGQCSRATCFEGGDDPNSTVKRMKRRIEKPFILEELLVAGDRIQRQLLHRYGLLIGNLRDAKIPTDTQLQQPWLNALNIPLLREELDKVQSHVDGCMKNWRDIFAHGPSKYDKKTEADTKRKALSKRKLAVAHSFARGPDGCETLKMLKMLSTVKASYAYSLNAKFAMGMAFQTLCSIKASATNSKAFTADFAEVVSMPAAARRVLLQDALALE